VARSINGYQLLLDHGTAPSSRFTATQRRELERLKAVGVVETQRRAGGVAVVVRNREAFVGWIRNQFPAGLAEAARSAPVQGEDRRTHGVRVLRDSKTIAGTGLQALTIRLAAAMPDGWDAVAVLIDDTIAPVRAPWANDAPVIALAENRTFFHRIDLAALGADAVVACEGRISSRLLRWCDAQHGARFLHCPDYDYVGLDEYRRALAALGDRVALHVPPRFVELLHRHGKRQLITSQAALSGTVRSFVATRHDDDALQRVFAAIRDTVSGLEQEALLLPFDATPTA
jgi:hypothetical protein